MDMLELAMVMASDTELDTYMVMDTDTFMDKWE